ncbi:hypothetical protein LPJ75_000434 [Coemansia sp. RSA 2598]|nr:hypothetical protein LPJ75_000434 [Coemansia sp. RSA 2598]
MKQIGLKYIDDLSISVFTLTDSEEEIFYNSTNYFFGSDLGNQENEDLGPICKKSNFVLNSLSYMLNPKMIAWSNISSITFTGTVRVSVLLKILKRVKTLEKLVVWSLDMDMDIDVVTSEKSLDASGHSSLSALNTSIRSLSIFDFKKTDASYCIGQNMLNVVLALPQLQRLISAEIVIESIKKYMQCRRTSGSGECIGSVCSCDMTHLSNIELIKT